MIPKVFPMVVDCGAGGGWSADEELVEGGRLSEPQIMGQELRMYEGRKGGGAMEVKTE